MADINWSLAGVVTSTGVGTPDNVKDGSLVTEASGGCSAGGAAGCYFTMDITVTFAETAPLITSFKALGQRRVTSGAGGYGLYMTIHTDGGWTQVSYLVTPTGDTIINGSWSNVTAIRWYTTGGGCGGLGGCYEYLYIAELEAWGASGGQVNGGPARIISFQ